MATCADCKKMNLNDEYNGGYWCEEKRAYYPGSDIICSEFDDGSRAGYSSGATCGECARLNCDDERYGEYWCKSKNNYCSEDERACSRFINKYGW